MRASEIVPGRLGRDIAAIAGSILDICLHEGWESKGGGFLNQSTIEDGHIVVIDPMRQEWWEQAEGMRALLMQAQASPQKKQDYLDRFTVMNSGALTADSNAYFDNVVVTDDPVCDAPCDMNCDGTVDASDIEPFIDILFNGATPCDSCTGDTNGDGTVDAGDIEGFINCLFP